MDKKGYPYDAIKEFGELNIENLNDELYPYPWGRQLGSVWNKTKKLEII